MATRRRRSRRRSAAKSVMTFARRRSRRSRRSGSGGSGGGLPAPSFSSRAMVPLLAAGAGAAAGIWAANYAVAKLAGNSTGWARIGIKAAAAIGIGMIVTRFAGRKYGSAAMIGALSSPVLDTIGRFTAGAGVQGLGAYDTPMIDGASLAGDVSYYVGADGNVYQTVS